VPIFTAVLLRDRRDRCWERQYPRLFPGVRDAWLNPPGASAAELKQRTLTNLYNQRPTWLELVHKQLDETVLDAYGWPHAVSDEEILGRLLALNAERAGRELSLSSKALERGRQTSATLGKVPRRGQRGLNASLKTLRSSASSTF
jgi:hypothetical protein